MSKNCILCEKPLYFWNQPIFGKGILKSLQRVCSSCFMRVNNKSPKTASNLKRYELSEIKNLLDLNKKIGYIENTAGFKVNTSIIPKATKATKATKDIGKWEVVYRKTKRWTQLGFGENDKFPGYGRLYEREFEVWYCEIGSKERKKVQKFSDKYPLNYNPRNPQNIIGEDVYTETLTNTKGYESLYTALDNKNRRRWYFALIKKKPLWIETERAIELETEKQTEIKVPEGWDLVKNHSEKWEALGYNNEFPGYGKIHEITFEIWYCNVGSKEKNNLTELKTELAIYQGNKLYYFERVYKQLNELNDVHLNFERLIRTNGYEQLYSATYKRQRWYLGIKKMTPRYIFTAGAN
ncbi:hypothetical protein ACFFVB_07540 [Formosa undariae]|uniref:HNH endonuclease n=1 Tax=Formosa undariae TaxID=1325436 RepID=A0ABV5F0G0_9FLAO